MIESAKARAGELEAFTLRHVATLKDEAEAEVARLKAAAEAELHSIGERVRTARDHLAKLTNI